MWWGPIKEHHFRLLKEEETLLLQGQLSLQKDGKIAVIGMDPYNSEDFPKTDTENLFGVKLTSVPKPALFSKAILAIKYRPDGKLGVTSLTEENKVTVLSMTTPDGKGTDWIEYPLNKKQPIQFEGPTSPSGIAIKVATSVLGRDEKPLHTLHFKVTGNNKHENSITFQLLVDSKWEPEPNKLEEKDTIDPVKKYLEGLNKPSNK